MTIDILCRVVDNYGDIGVAYRLAKALSDLDPELRLRLVVDGLPAFHALAPEVDPTKESQDFRGWKLLTWDPSPEIVASVYGRGRPRFVVECFACGKPDWFEALAFDESLPGETVILNLEYLTAEPYAREFHLLEAATRSSRVRKYFFMPGFEEGTGGLLADARFRASRERFLDPSSRVPTRLQMARAAGLEIEPAWADRLWVLVFSYERDYGRIAADLAEFDGGGAPGGRRVLALAAAGKSQACFRNAWQAAGKPYPALDLPFLPQEAWDELLLAADFSLVRGEESLSRAVLSGKPFLWQAYPQAGRHQLVKVEALLARMRPFFEPGAFAALENAFLAFNDRLVDGPDTRGEERLLFCLEALPALEEGFLRFSREICALGDLSQRLFTFFGGFM